MQAVGTMNKLTDENDRANLQTRHVELDFAIVPRGEAVDCRGHDELRESGR